MAPTPHLRIVQTPPNGPAELLLGETVVRVTPAAPDLPAQLPDATTELLRLCRVQRVEDIGLFPPLGALSLQNGSIENSAAPFRLFEAVFGRDSLIMARLLRDRYPALLHTTLRFLAEQQGLPRNSAPEPQHYGARGEEPGRIPHEIRDPGHDPRARELTAAEGWQWPFYRSDDATLIFLQLLAEEAEADPSYLDRTVVQRDGVQRSYGDVLLAALEWAFERSANPAGLVFSERNPPTSAPSNYPTWQDSGDSTCRADGSLATGPVAFAELQGPYYDALTTLSRLCRTRPGGASRLHLDPDALEQQALRLRRSVLAEFSVPESGRVAYAVERMPDGRLNPLGVLKSDPARLLDSDILLAPECTRFAQAIARQLFDPRCGLITPAGIRTLSDLAPTFRPGGYHTGQVWMIDNHLAALGLARHGMPALAAALDGALVRTCATLRHYPEYVRGDADATPSENRVITLVRSHDPAFGSWVNCVAQPGQLVQGWTLFSFVDAQQKLLQVYPSAPVAPVHRATERKLLAAFSTLRARKPGDGGMSV